MDPTEPQASPDPLAYSASNPLADADPFWVQRLYLGLSGIAIAQWLEIAEWAMTILLLLAARSEIGGVESLIYLLPNVNSISFAILWFSAVFLLATSEPGHNTIIDAPAVSVRKLMIYFGSAAVLLACFPSAVYPTGGIWLGRILPFVSVAGHIMLLLYLLQLADRAQDAYLKKHIPMVLALVLLRSAFTIAGRFGFTRAVELQPILNVAAVVYFLHVVLRLRKIFAAAVPDAAVKPL